LIPVCFSETIDLIIEGMTNRNPNMRICGKFEKQKKLKNSPGSSFFGEGNISVEY